MPKAHSSVLVARYTWGSGGNASSWRCIFLDIGNLGQTYHVTGNKVMMNWCSWQNGIVSNLISFTFRG